MEYKKILMVCLGNICRSPLAQGILNNKVNHLNIEVDSAGTANYHIGFPPDSSSIAVVLKNNIDVRK
jgi:protein-tyrosine phosphatase